MRGINSVTISGRVGKEPELRTTPSGSDILEFSVAVKDQRKSGDEWTDTVHWVRCVIFGRRCEFFQKHLKKGSFVVINGALMYSEWEKDGSKRNALKVRVGEIDLGPKTAPSAGGDRPGKTEIPATDNDGSDDDYIPF